MKKFDSIDLSKFIASILIVALHTDLFYDVNSTLYTLVCGGIARLGVPFFFVASSFFYFRKPVNWDNTKNYCKRLLILYAAWFIILLPKTVFDYFISSKYSIGITVFRFIRAFFVTGTFSGSWFLLSCIFCALFYYLISRLNKNVAKAITVPICVIVYAWVTFTSGYGALISKFGLNNFYNSYEMILGNPYFSFMVGIPYFAIGKLFANKYNENKIQNYSKALFISGFIAALILLMLEVLICNNKNLSRSTDSYIMLLPCVFCLFPILLKWDINLKNAKILRISSTVIFFSQFIFIFAIDVIEWAFKFVIPYSAKFLIVVVLGIFTTWIVLLLSDKKGFKWVKYLY